mgnify:CR=1 FL=1
MRYQSSADKDSIQDSDERIQSYVSINELGEEAYKAFKTWDIGDIIGISGFVFKTRTEEISVHAKEVTLLTKSLRPLPEKFHGLTDVESKYRERYVDLMMNEESRKIFLGRSKFYSFVHRYLDENGFVEIEVADKYDIEQSIWNITDDIGATLLSYALDYAYENEIEILNND